ncbi:TMEM165/GDT1 family protein [Hephaestia sp. GCM10023244]|uniref:TMEM165/GDT1 family protein n=1 Tax=unclassified Hephaestia TaxID=2631281 RepID=UPI002076DEE9|nr:TMEM165/GDT1 family protein [Hephaestia sp. MAHUQ-44]MCM8731025.1 TMEM165/GDT1 family protein [Hephaestia sp. MAHUQ-44]
MAALVAALFAQASDRTPWCAALLGSRFARPVPVVTALVVAIVVINGLGAAAGAVIGPMLTPEASTLLLALALVSAGAAAVFPLKAPDALPDSRFGALLTSLLALLALGIGDRTQFITFALAARTPIPALAFVGATLGALAVMVPAALMGEAAWKALPLRVIRHACCGVLAVAGVLIGLRALGLL